LVGRIGGHVLRWAEVEPSTPTIAAADGGTVDEVETFCAAVVPLLLEAPEGADGPPVRSMESQVNSR